MQQKVTKFLTYNGETEWLFGSKDQPSAWKTTNMSCYQLANKQQRQRIANE